MLTLTVGEATPLSSSTPNLPTVCSALDLMTPNPQTARSGRILRLS